MRTKFDLYVFIVYLIFPRTHLHLDANIMITSALSYLNISYISSRRLNKLCLPYSVLIQDFPPVEHVAGIDNSQQIRSLEADKLSDVQGE